MAVQTADGATVIADRPPYGEAVFLVDPVTGIPYTAGGAASALPPGNNNIGDVDIASIAPGTNNIGDVDVLTLPAIPAGTNNIGHVGGVEYETVAASATAQVLGATGAVGDYLSHVLVIPATTSPGAVSITDGNGSAITIFAGGASSVTSLIPFAVPIGAKCTAATSAGWKVTTGTNVAAIGFGDFT